MVSRLLQATSTQIPNAAEHMFPDVIPDPSFAAINLTFVLREATPLKRTAGIELPRYRTSLCATERSNVDGSGIDISHSGPYSTVDVSKSARHDLDFPKFKFSVPNSGLRQIFYQPGNLAGCWDGTVSVSHHVSFPAFSNE